jgi:hypothetical protein
MSRVRYDQFPRIVTVPRDDQSATQLLLKEFVQTCQCPPGWSQETCYANMNRQTGEPVLESMPTGAVFSIADDSEQCTLAQRRSCAKTVGITRPFEPSMMNQDLVFTLGREAPRGFQPSEFRGEARWFDGDDYKTGTFWKSGPRAGFQANVNAQGTQRLPFSPESTMYSEIVDVPRTFETGANIRYPQAWALVRALN